ncbi:hypothetical protein BG003_002042 [Podila horticola]|nr:hypothetical protein BG003_002042 [Podila horticola]
MSAVRVQTSFLPLVEDKGQVKFLPRPSLTKTLAILEQRKPEPSQCPEAAEAMCRKVRHSKIPAGKDGKVKADDYADLVITEHNKARSHFGAPPLTWSDSLASAAQGYANQCIWEHDQSRGDDIGENLGQSSDGNGVPVQYVQME